MDIQACAGGGARQIWDTTVLAKALGAPWLAGWTPERGQKRCWLAPGLWFPAAAVAGWVSQSPCCVCTSSLSGINVSRDLPGRLGVPKAGWCPLGRCVGALPHCAPGVLTTLSAQLCTGRKGTALRTCCGDVRGLWQPWGCHTWHLSLFPALSAHSGHGSVLPWWH